MNCSILIGSITLFPADGLITVEMMFYGMVPFLFDRIRNIDKALLFLTFTLCVRYIFLLLMIYVVLPGRTEINHDFLYWCLPNQLPIFGLGIFLFFYIKKDYKIEGLTLKSIIFLFSRYTYQLYYQERSDAESFFYRHRVYIILCLAE